MASPMHYGGQTGNWQGSSMNQMGHAMPQGNDFQEPGPQVRPMGLKVHYTFDKDGKVNCLARHPLTLQVQTIPLDETNAIGIVDLRNCIQAIMECSPELFGQENDFTIYAHDYSEPDTPLVGQGMLSWVIDTLSHSNPSQPLKMVTGRVTKNLLAVFGGGNREILEVKLKLAASNRLQKPEPPRQQEMPQSRPMESASTPLAMTPTGEWNAFIQNNPQIGQPQQQPQHPPRDSSPALSHASFGGRSIAAQPAKDTYHQSAPSAGASSDLRRIAPIPVEPCVYPKAQPALQQAVQPPAASSRPSSRASNASRPRKKRPSTGQPKGRPRRKPAEGHTSGYEDGTEGEEAPPPRKRVQTTKGDKTTVNPFGAGPDSLRVAASTSGSLRSFRPIASGAELAGNPNHLQDVPRAPTPVPSGAKGPPGRPPLRGKDRRASAMNQELLPQPNQRLAEAGQLPYTMQEDSRSPDSIGATPNYSEDSPVDVMEIGSSPPVTRNTPYIRSSPPPSSPLLPPMPGTQMSVSQSHVDISLESFDMDDILFGDESMQTVRYDSFTTQTLPRNPLEITTSNNVPVQVFQLQGPEGQSMVHIRNYNTPQPTSTPAGPPENTALPPLPRENSNMSMDKAYEPQAFKQPSPPALVPTPPPTTDFLDKPNSPLGDTDATPIVVPEDPMESPPAGDVQPASRPNNNGPKRRSKPPTKLASGSKTPPTVETVPLPDLPAQTSRPSTSHDAASAQDESFARDGSAESQIQRLRKGQTPRESMAPSMDGASDAPPPPQAPTAPMQGAASDATAKPAPASKPKRVRKKPPRELTRSQSASAAMLAAPAASEPAGPSSLSQSMTAGFTNSRGGKIPAALKRSASIGPTSHPVPASDPVVPMGPTTTGLVLPEGMCAYSDAMVPTPSSPSGSKSSKNMVKKHAIKQKLEDAIKNGQMPPFCNNCGAIETPTWRKIWTQDHEGIPPEMDFSEKPGRVTAVEVLLRDAEDVPIKYRLIKKSLGPDEDKDDWGGLLLCNPCGIWLVKSKCHRPQDRWEKDFSRLGQDRKRSSNGANSRAKRSRTKAQVAANPTSDAYFATDGVEPTEPPSPRMTDELASQLGVLRSGSQGEWDTADLAPLALAGDSMSSADQTAVPTNSVQNEDGAKSPADKELDAALGTTRRILFPSPSKATTPKVLGEVHVNIVQTSECQLRKETATEKENASVPANEESASADDDLEALFRSPAAMQRPCTPPPAEKSTNGPGPFKTPTRPTPSHRPITRSVSRSLKSARSLKSPFRMGVESPTSSRSRSAFTPGGRPRRSPRNQVGAFDGSEFGAELMMLTESGAGGNVPIGAMLTPSAKWALGSVMRNGPMSTSPTTQSILDMLEKPAPMSPSPSRQRAANALADSEMDQLNWLDVLKSPAAQKALESHKMGGDELESWYSGAADAWDEWMKEHSQTSTQDA